MSATGRDLSASTAVNAESIASAAASSRPSKRWPYTSRVVRTDA
jgi:hypothetical protein